MKKTITFLMGSCILLIFSQSARSQSSYKFKLNGKSIDMIGKVEGKEKVLNAEDLKTVPVVAKTKFDLTELGDGATIVFTFLNAGGVEDIKAKTELITSPTNGVYQIVKGDIEIQSLNLKVTTKDGTTNDFKGLKFSAGKKENTPDPDLITQKYATWRDYVANNTSKNLEIIKAGKRYFRSDNKAYICLDPYGNIIGRKPVNLDQDDEIIFLVIVPKDLYDLYSIDDNDAEYAPSDLNIRPSEAIVQSEQKVVDQTFIVKEFIKGPYTASNVTFNIKREQTSLSSFTLHINALYHLGLGVSYVGSNLASPDYQLSPLSAGGNTISEVNGGNRTFLTANVVWYWWSTFKYLNGDVLTRGRDVLKEPDLITRFNPTFGISLSENIRNNFFAGLTFEFARGGSLVGGWHYGKINRLVDQNFQLGSQAFSGAATDIKTEQVWKSGAFFGITIDTRIFNRLFPKSAPGGS